MSKTINLQHEFINQLRKKRKRVEIYLINSIRLTGYIESFDQQMIMIHTHAGKQVIYKYAISTIQLNGTSQKSTSKQEEHHTSRAIPRTAEPLASVSSYSPPVKKRYTSPLYAPDKSYPQKSFAHTYQTDDDQPYYDRSLIAQATPKKAPSVIVSKRRSYTIPPEDLRKTKKTDE